MKRYDEIFASTPEVAAVAPGRVNLLGEHTDYNDGFVLPIAIAQCARVTLGRSREATTSVYAADFDQLARFTLEDTPQERFARMVQGCLRILAEQGVAVPALDIHVTSQVPMGAGLSSSAALQVALLRALDRLLGLALDGVRIAQLGQQVETRFAGVQCGIMDQMAASLADAQHMLFIDTRTPNCWCSTPASRAISPASATTRGARSAPRRRAASASRRCATSPTQRAWRRCPSRWRAGRATSCARTRACCRRSPASTPRPSAR